MKNAHNIRLIEARKPLLQTGSNSSQNWHEWLWSPAFVNLYQHGLCVLWI